MGQQHISLSLTTRSDRDWSAAYSLLTDIILDHGNEFAQTSLSTVDLDDFMSEDSRDGNEIYHDENTMGKVRDAIQKAAIERFGPELTYPGEFTQDIVTALLNAGILFRERKS